MPIPYSGGAKQSRAAPARTICLSRVRYGEARKCSGEVLVPIILTPTCILPRNLARR